MPSKYALGKRAVQQADTRRRIIDAALALYQEQGVSATTMLDVARRADVAPGHGGQPFRVRRGARDEVTDDDPG